MREEYHYVSPPFPTPSPSTAAAAQRNMPAHITFRKPHDRNCNLTVERSCAAQAAPAGSGGAGRRAQVHLSVSSHKRSRFLTLAELAALPRPIPSPEPRAARVTLSTLAPDGTGRDDTRMLSSPTQRKTLTPENTGLRRRLDRSYAISFHPPSFLAQVRAATFV